MINRNLEDVNQNKSRNRTANVISFLLFNLIQSFYQKYGLFIMVSRWLNSLLFILLFG